MEEKESGEDIQDKLKNRTVANESKSKLKDRKERAKSSVQLGWLLSNLNNILEDQDRKWIEDQFLVPVLAVELEARGREERRWNGRSTNEIHTDKEKPREKWENSFSCFLTCRGRKSGNTTYY